MDSKILAIVLLGSCFLIDATSASKYLSQRWFWGPLYFIYFKVPKFLESLIYIIILYHFIAGPPPLETTNPATMTEYKGVSCKARKWSPNTLTGKIATCIKDPKCWAVERSVYCKERRGPHVFTKRVGLVNLVEKEGATVWIKGKHKSQRLL